MKTIRFTVTDLKSKMDFIGCCYITGIEDILSFMRNNISNDFINLFKKI